jgi:hypothetical protein
LDKRVRSHLRQLRACQHPNAALQAAWAEHGESSFEVTTFVLGLDKSELRRLELDLVARTGALDPARGFNARAVV